MISGTYSFEQKMETEQPCPFCKRIHYSIYTVERCAARHQAGDWSSYLIEEREKRKKPARPQPAGNDKVTALFD
jgi:hypothetical protein